MSLHGLAVLFVGVALEVALHSPSAPASVHYAFGLRFLLALALAFAFALQLLMHAATGAYSLTAVGHSTIEAALTAPVVWSASERELDLNTALRARTALVLLMLLVCVLPLPPGAFVWLEALLTCAQCTALYLQPQLAPPPAPPPRHSRNSTPRQSKEQSHAHAHGQAAASPPTADGHDHAHADAHGHDHDGDCCDGHHEEGSGQAHGHGHAHSHDPPSSAHQSHGESPAHYSSNGHPASHTSHESGLDEEAAVVIAHAHSLVAGEGHVSDGSPVVVRKEDASPASGGMW